MLGRRLVTRGGAAAIASSKEAGYDLIQLAALEPETFDADLTARLLQEHDIQGDVSLGLSEETDISSEDPDCVARGRRLLDTAVKLTRDIGGAYLGGVLYSKLGKYAAPVTERGRANSVESIAWVADRAAEAGVTLGLEFCNRYETNVLNTTEQTLAFIEDVDRPNVMAHLDVYHMNIEEVSFADAVTRPRRRGGSATSTSASRTVARWVRGPCRSGSSSRRCTTSTTRAC